MRRLVRFPCAHRKRRVDGERTLCTRCGAEVRYDRNWPAHPWTSLADMILHRMNDPAKCARQPCTFAMAQMEDEREARGTWDVLERR